MPRYAYKGVDSNMHTSFGKGFTFELNKWYEEDSAKTVSCGFHCANNPLTCLQYFPASVNSRYFIVEVDGDVDEDEADRIACTRIRFIKELTLVELVGHAIMYINKHPKLDSSEYVKKETYFSKDEAFVIVRGKEPSCAARKGTIVGLLKEEKDSPTIIEANLYMVDGIEHKPNCYYLVDNSRKNKRASA